MIREIIHVGITVSDIDRSIEFYRDVLKLKYIGRMKMQGEETDKLFGRKNVIAHVAYLNGSDHIKTAPLEIIQFENQIEEDQPSLFKKSISEICFKVDDIESTYKELLENEVEVISPPQFFDMTEYGFSKSKALYFKDPDGIILELIEEV